MADPSGAQSGRICSSCSVGLAREHYSSRQWKTPAHSRRCKNCIEHGGAPPDLPPVYTEDDASAAMAGADALPPDNEVPEYYEDAQGRHQLAEFHSLLAVLVHGNYTIYQDTKGGLDAIANRGTSEVLPKPELNANDVPGPEVDPDALTFAWYVLETRGTDEETGKVWAKRYRFKWRGVLLDDDGPSDEGAGNASEFVSRWEDAPRREGGLLYMAVESESCFWTMVISYVRFGTALPWTGGGNCPWPDLASRIDGVFAEVASTQDPSALPCMFNRRTQCLADNCPFSHKARCGICHIAPMKKIVRRRGRCSGRTCHQFEDVDAWIDAERNVMMPLAFPSVFDAFGNRRQDTEMARAIADLQANHNFRLATPNRSLPFE